jgi:dipeptidyl aminopeptidase/acylaminoacyl peptidase
VYFFSRPYAWVSSKEIVCPVLPEGEQPFLVRMDSWAAETAMRVWPRAWEGRETTASVLRSGAPVGPSDRPQGKLLVVDVTDGSSKVIATGIAAPTNARSLALSPDRRLAAYLQEIEPPSLDPDVPLDFDSPYWYTLRMASTDGRAVAALPAGIGRDVLATSPQWSPDGSELAFISYAESRRTSPRIHSFSPVDGSVHTFGTGRLDPVLREGDPKLLWTTGGELLVYAAMKGGEGRASRGARRDWWVLDRGGSERALTEGMEEPPRELVAEMGLTSFVGPSGGDLWNLRPAGGAPENLTGDFEPELTSIAWPSGPDDILTDCAATAGCDQLILGAQNGELTDYYMVDLPMGSPRELHRSLPDASVAALDPVGGTVLLGADEDTGTSLWADHAPYGGFKLLFETNTFLRGVAAGERTRIEYRSHDGEDLKGWILLPPGHRPGEKLPLVVEVYPGIVQDPSPGWLTEINNSHAHNLQVLAAAGYAVLQPSMPLGPDGEAADVLLDLPKGVLPAVERAVELGVADPDRVFLLGHSYGGYGVYGLIAGTHRFRAAVALAGFCNLTSLYGTFEAWQRYAEDAHRDMFQPALLETGQGRMGSPPWKDSGRYVRNSPIFYADRVRTPLLIIQGDMDYVAMQQGEELFTALYRQGKRAEFVRYWGEGHILESPANIRDMWARILAWFEEFGSARGSPDA